MIRLRKKLIILGRRKSGQSLLEIMLAVMISVLALLALGRLTMLSVRNTSFSRDRTLATHYTQQAYERLRAFRDMVPTWNLFKNDCQAGSVPLGTPDPPFQLAWTCDCTPESGTVCQIDIEVSWESDGRPHHSNLNTQITQWQSGICFEVGFNCSQDEDCCGLNCNPGTGKCK
ncbi:hypothetical protein ACFL0Y_01765 [Patescibacteria group bacterium]